VNGSIAEVVAAIRAHDTFIVTSHARPDGDAVGSSLALALALDALGKSATVILHDPIPAPYRAFPATDRVRVSDRADVPAQVAILLECSDVTRPEIAGLERYAILNVDHHTGNAMYGVANWFDVSAAACGEQVATLIDALGVLWTPAIAAHLYLALSTDTGSFRYGPVSARTFDLCRRVSETGVSTSELSRQIFDSFTVGRVRLTGAILNAMELHHGNRLALLSFDEPLLRQCGALMDDTEGLVNLPLGAEEVVASALIKRQDETTFRLSLRSKGAVDVRRVATRWNGGGHTNAAGCTAVGTEAEVRAAVVQALSEAIDLAGRVKSGA
jgi:bifunctional oligoribonuclease and PAP phosphatase NrnA